MRHAILLLLAIALASSAKARAVHSPVVVELFTSEGCSSCPPADALLGELSQKGPSTADVIILAEHVDYWNADGWRDRFSSPQFTQRQADYVQQFRLASSYTPQMVIDGRIQVSGNNRPQVYSDLASAAAVAKPAHVHLAWQPGGRLQIAIQTAQNINAYVVLALTEDGLSTQVHDGENRGRTLRHSGVVRKLQVLGKANGGTYDKVVDANPHGDWNPANLKAAVFVQQSDGKIIGAAAIPYQDGSPASH